MDIHHGARENINRRTAEVLIGATPTRAHPAAQRSYRPDLHVTQRLARADIHGEIEKTIVNGMGQVVGFGFELDGVQCEIAGGAYEPVSALIDTIAATKGFSGTVSRDWLKTRMHRWIRDTLRRTTVEPFLAYIESEFASDVRQYEFWMPITQLHVKRGFRLGKGSILPIEKSLIDRIQQSAADRYPERANASRAFTDRFYRRYQGFAAFVVTRNVEISWGWELAFEDARVAAAMIRVFSGQAMAPEVRSGVAPWGCAQGDAIHGFALTEGFQAAGIEGGRGVDPSPLIWDDEGILQAHREGLAVVSAILAKDDRSDYEEKLLEMLLLYSGGLVRTDPADRLMYTLIALEQMFLRSESEPITQNLADRIALFAADTVDDRRKVMQLVRRAYATRSRFVHHGQTVAELNDLGDFLREAWMTVILLIGRSAWFNTREELLDAIDTAKLSGASLSARAPDGNAAA